MVLLFRRSYEAQKEIWDAASQNLPVVFYLQPESSYYIFRFMLEAGYVYCAEDKAFYPSSLPSKLSGRFRSFRLFCASATNISERESMEAPKSTALYETTYKKLNASEEDSAFINDFALMQLNIDDR